MTPLAAKPNETTWQEVSSEQERFQRKERAMYSNHAWTGPDKDLIAKVSREVADEVWRASCKHKPMNSAHEAYAVILEELDEFWDEVKKKSEERTQENLRTELIQTAAMCIRTIHDLGL